MLGGAGAGLACGGVLAVEALHVELEVAVTVEPARCVKERQATKTDQVGRLLIPEGKLHCWQQ